MVVTRRRTLLALGLAIPGSWWLVGCTVGAPDGVDPSTSPTSAPTTPTPPDPYRMALDEAAAAESRFASDVRAVVGRRYGLSQARLDNLDALGDRHRRYARVLTAEDPLARRLPPTPSPGPSDGTAGGAPTTPAPADERTALADLVTAAQRLAREHSNRATTSEPAEPGARALLWASLAAAARRDVLVLGSGAAIDDPPAAPPTPALPELVTPDQGAQRVVAGLHAAVWGYQVALARFDGASADPVRERLIGLRALRDEVVDVLTDLGAEVPTPSPDYDPGEPVDDTTSARALMARIESRLPPVLGGWVAAAEADARALAVTALGDTAMTGITTGATVALWPGWPD